MPSWPAKRTRAAPDPDREPTLPLESSIKTQIGKALKARECRVTVNNVGLASGPAGHMVMFNTPGMPDLSVITPDNTIFFIEVKRPGEKLRATQERWHAKAKARGMLVYVCTSEAEAIAAFDEVQRRKGVTTGG